MDDETQNPKGGATHLVLLNGLECIMEVNREDLGACSCPPALDDLDLIAAIDGEASEDVLGHLRDCPCCAERAQDFAQLQELRRRRLYRVLCPSSEELVAYRQGWMEVWRRDEI